MILKIWDPKFISIVTVKNVFSLKNVGLTKQGYTEQWDCTTQNSEIVLNRTVRLHYTEQWDCTTQNSEIAIHRTVRLQYIEQWDCATQNSETALNRTVRLLQRAMLCPIVYLKNVVLFDSEICVIEIGFSKITKFYLHFSNILRPLWTLGAAAR